MSALGQKLECAVCGEAGVESVSTAMGERRYCLNCFHGWRPRMESFPYDAVPMCPLGTSDARLKSQVGFFGRFLPKGGSVLEIGCATGELAAATQAALDVGRYEAIELSPAADRASARVDRLHREPLQSLLKAEALGSPFDLVIISHVLEHIPDPIAEVRAIKQALRDDGVVFIEVPNRSGNRSLPLDDNRSHLHFFSPTSLMRLLADQGLEVLEVATGAWLDARYADSLRVAARAFSRPKWRSHFLCDRLPGAPDEKIVVWGAGSLAEEVLANFFDLARIDFFVDRNPSKHGTSCLGLPVLDPEALGAQPRTVLVNSIDFADSIAADIAALYPQTPHRIVRVAELFTAAEGQP